MVYALRFFPLLNAACFIILTYLVPVLFTFYLQGVLKLKKNKSGAKSLTLLCLTIYNFQFSYTQRGNTLSGYTMFRGSVKSTGYQFHSPVSTSFPVRHRVPSHFNWTLPPRVTLHMCTWTAPYKTSLHVSTY